MPSIQLATIDEMGLLVQIISLLDAGFIAYNANPYNTKPLPDGIESAKAFQPRQQGAQITPTVYVNLENPKRIGFPKRQDVWDATNGIMQHFQSQRMESTYHIEALVPQSPADSTGMTEADVLNVAAFILQCDATIAALAALNVGLLRVTELRSNYVEDDKDQNENVPFFEITFSHRVAVTLTTPTIDEFNTVFARV